MKQITEDFVSYETAVLLKEKGFDEPCIAYWDDDEHKLRVVYPIYKFRNITNPSFFGPSAPTQSLALKWLREVHNIVIEINMEDYMTSKNGELQVWYSYTIWTFIRHLGETGLVDSRYDDRAFWQENVKVGQSYEQAVEASLKYTLENLI